MFPALKLLRELIALPSVNPAFLDGSPHLTGEARVAELLAFLAGREGLEIDFQEVFPGRSNLLVRLIPPGGKPRQRILLAPHLDTVCGTAEQFVPVLSRGRLHGRGACDTKGSVAAMAAALLDVASRGARPKETEVVFAGLVDEENGQTGSRHLAASDFRADLAIVGEPTRLDVVSAHKGDLWLRLETRGRAAHGSLPHLGRNAVHEAARLVDLLETTYAGKLRRRRHPLLGHGTISVGSIRGGVQANIVPDECSVIADRRTLPGETESTVRRELAALFRRHKFAVRIHDTKGATCDPLETDPNLPLVQRFLASAGRRRTKGVSFFCDAAPLAAGGTPAIVFGPGDLAQAHTADEWIAVESLERGTAVLTRFLRSLP
ncbi:MAG: M20 family metallopeptidase [Verrucomicrobia bacterium]|nr:M20 family metallopeptidase [Verrucomicrobiota bacterium]